jgi:putative hydrolase of HD superfamily
MIETLLEIYDLKDEKRTGWDLRNIEGPESVAGHSWGVAFLALSYMPEKLDSEKVLKLAVVHDVAEAEVGDIAKRAVDAENEVTEKEKEILEEEAAEEYAEILGNFVTDNWEEYQERETEEAKFVKDMDLIDMCLQALKYERQGRYDPEEENENFQKYDDLDEFFATTEPRLNTEKGEHLFKEIIERYEQAKNSR